MSLRIPRVVPCLLGFAALTAAGASPSLRVVRLACDGRVAPVGVDSPAPSVSWQLEAAPEAPRGASQTAYRVVVSATEQAVVAQSGDLWDSGRVPSASTTGIRYAGQPLVSSQRVFWRVCVWDQSGSTTWSEPSSWTMGVLRADDWTGPWIGIQDSDTKWPPVPGVHHGEKAAKDAVGIVVEPGRPHSLLLRRGFGVRPGLVRAVLHSSGLGHQVLSVNGRRIGDHVLSPGWTDYRRTVLYESHEVTSFLRPGPNTLGALLGNGMYHVELTKGRYNKFAGSFGPPKLRALLRLEYADGSAETITTDERWQWRPGPMTYSDVFGGEDYDARLLPVRWDDPVDLPDGAVQVGGPDEGWSPAAVVQAPPGRLAGLSVAGDPVRLFETIQPVKVRSLRPGVLLYDFGQNTAFIPELRVEGEAGAQVRLIPSELLGADGAAQQGSSGGPSFWNYTLSGAGVETYASPFFYRGGRYLQVELTATPGSQALPRIVGLALRVSHADAPVAGSFTSSNELFNRIWHLVRWAQRSNLVSVLTDCPHREKLGWLEQLHLNGPAFRYNFDLHAVMAKCVNDMADAQQPDGFVPNIAPEFVRFGGDNDKNPFRNSPEWGAAFILAAWQQHLFHDDLSLFERHHAAMGRYVDYLQGKARGHILDFGLGDWYDIGPKPPGYAQLTPRALTATATYHEVVSVMARVSSALGRTQDAARYEALARDIAGAFNRAFLPEGAASYSTGSQTANSMPLVLGLVPDNRRADVLAAIVADVQTRGLTAGDVGYRYLQRALADNGRSDVIYDLNNQSEKPGYGYQLAKGATALTEAWDARPQSSNNHFMLGQINEWFFHDLAGIQPLAEAPGFARFVVHPALDLGLASLDVTFNSARGAIQVSWETAQDGKLLRVLVPANTEAVLRLDGRRAADVSENGQELARIPGANVSRDGAKGTPLEVRLRSGSYEFTVAPRSLW